MQKRIWLQITKWATKLAQSQSFNVTGDQAFLLYRLSRAPNEVENTFGILSERFRVFRRPFECDLEPVDVTTKTACVLHNYLIFSPTSTGTANTVNTEE